MPLWSYIVDFTKCIVTTHHIGWKYLCTFLAIGNDFTVTEAPTGSGRVINSGSTFTTLSVQHIPDNVAQEKDEQYNISLTNSLGLQDYTFQDTTVTVVDTDSK